jgi:hypothetical protein
MHACCLCKEKEGIATVSLPDGALGAQKTALPLCPATWSDFSLTVAMEGAQIKLSVRLKHASPSRPSRHHQPSHLHIPTSFSCRQQSAALSPALISSLAPDRGLPHPRGKASGLKRNNGGQLYHARGAREYVDPLIYAAGILSPDFAL